MLKKWVNEEVMEKNIIWALALMKRVEN